MRLKRMIFFRMQINAVKTSFGRKCIRILSELSGMPGPFFTANYTMAYLGSSFQEAVSLFTKEPPAASRDQSNMVGKYYWYDHSKVKRLGYRPAGARAALAEATSWMVGSEHIPSSVRALMNLSGEVYRVRRAEWA